MIMMIPEEKLQGKLQALLANNDQALT